LATFPRYNVLNAIRIEVERIDPADLFDLENTRGLLVLAGEAAVGSFYALDGSADNFLLHETARCSSRTAHELS
jgi:hypothetical protein